MRQIGFLEDETRAKQFADYLMSQGIAGQMESESQRWVIWIRDEKHVQAARDALAEFSANPDAPQFQNIATEVRQARVRQEKKELAEATELRGRWKRRSNGRPLTIAVIVICAVIFLITDHTPPDHALKRILGLFDRATVVDRSSQIREGQVWRIFTPNLMHGDIVHIAFNMMWFLGFGTQIELRQGKFKLLAIILITGIGTMGAELLLSDGWPIGMSGVVYGMFAYVWMRSRFDPRSGYYMSNQTVKILMIFFFVGWSGILALLGTNVANWGHTGGLVVGLIWGYVPTQFRQR